MLKGFKDFLLRGNVVDLAVAVVIGAAFGAVVTAFVENFITPFLAAVVSAPDMSEAYVFRINGAEFRIGLIINAVINFVLVAAAIYFIVVMPMKKLLERTKKEDAVVEVPPTEDVVLLTEIRDLLRAQQQRPLG